MAIHVQGAPASVVSLSSEIRIEAHTGIAWFLGTSEQLQAEGLIPSGITWPADTEIVLWEIGSIIYQLRRSRPAPGVPKAVWRQGDFWQVGCYPKTCIEAPVVAERRKALAAAIRAVSPEGLAEGWHAQRARRDPQYAKFRDALLPRGRRA